MPKFISNHGLVLLRIILGGDATVATISDDVKISEQATHAIVRELVTEGFITSKKVGRRRTYRGEWVEGFNHRQQGMTLRDIVTVLAAVAGMMSAPKARVLLYLAEHPHSSLTQIASDKHLAKDEARTALLALEEGELVCRQERRGKTTYAIHPQVRSEQDRLLSPLDEIALVRKAKVQIPDPMETLDRILGPVAPENEPEAVREDLG
jgi:DNA-binding IclR family transcriptional regulator